MLGVGNAINEAILRDLLFVLTRHGGCLVWRVNSEFLITETQGNIDVLLGMRHEQILNLDIRQLVEEKEHPKLIQLVAKAVLRAYKEKSSLTFSDSENKILSQQMQWIILPLIDIEQNIQSIYVIGFNGELIKQKNDAARKLRFLENIIDNVPHFLFWKDKNSVFLGCNDQFAKSARLSSSAEIIGKTDYDLPWEKEESDAYVADDREVMETGKAKINIEEIQTVNDEEMTLLTSKVPIYEKDGSVMGVLGIYSNITERKKTEKEFHIAIQKAEVASHAKTNFLAKISHELRTPLNGILGTAQILMNKNYDKMLKEHIKDIESATTYLLDLVNDILDFTCFGQIVVRYEPINISELPKKVVASTAYRITHNKTRLNHSIDENLPLLVVGDAFRIKQILINLVNNAIKFTPEGTITVGAKCLKRTTTKAKIRFFVQDTGIGIKEEMQKKIFESFFQADAGYSRTNKGVGLGLAISQQLAIAMGSQVYVESYPDKGSLFWMDLELDILNLHKNSAYRQFYETVYDIEDNLYDEAYDAYALVVEDNQLNQKIICNMLTGLGCRVDVAANGKIAIELARENSYEIIFMDIGLPYMDGLEVTKEIRKIAVHLDTPIIATTAHAFETDIQSCRDASLNDVLIKPIAISGLKKILSIWAKKS